MPVSNTDANFDIEDNHGHVPVMRSRMAELIAPAVEAAGDNAVIVDGTLGAGGHTEFFLRAFPQARVIGVDRDAASLEQATQRLAPFRDRFIGITQRFDAIGREIDDAEGELSATAPTTA